jgi:hypothetical protein
MVLRKSLTKLRAKLKPDQDKKHEVSSEEFLRNGAYRHVNSRPIVPRSIGSQSSDPPRFSPDYVGIQPYQTSDGINVVELDAAPGAWTDGRQPNMYWEEKQRQAAERSHYEDIERAKKQSKREAEERKRAEAEKQAKERKREECKQNVRLLRGLIRDRHRLDLTMWQRRHVQEADRDWVMLNVGERADEILQRIYSIVDSWEPNIMESEERAVAQKIKETLAQRDQHAKWQEIPPWDREEDVKRKPLQSLTSVQY